MVCNRSAGSCAIFRFLPIGSRRDGAQVSLHEPQQNSATTRTDPLIVVLGRIARFVLVAKLSLYRDEILDVHARGKRLAAAPAHGLFRLRADIFVKGGSKLSRPLENVKELAEGQPEQGHDNGDGVKDG